MSSLIQLLISILYTFPPYIIPAKDLEDFQKVILLPLCQCLIVIYESTSQNTECIKGFFRNYYFSRKLPLNYLNEWNFPYCHVLYYFWLHYYKFVVIFNGIYSHNTLEMKISTRCLHFMVSFSNKRLIEFRFFLA